MNRTNLNVIKSFTTSIDGLGGITPDYPTNSSHCIVDEFRVIQNEFEHMLKQRRDRKSRMNSDWMHILNCLDTCPIESGMEHIAEQLMRTFISKYGYAFDEPDVKASEYNKGQLCQIWSRLHVPVTKQEGSVKFPMDCVYSIVDECLRSDQLAIRDMAIQAIEQWNDDLLWARLKEHQEPNPCLLGHIVALFRERDKAKPKSKDDKMRQISHSSCLRLNK